MPFFNRTDNEDLILAVQSAGVSRGRNGFRKDKAGEKLAEDDTLIFADPVTFETEAEAIAFCDGLAHGLDERAPATRIPLLTSNDSDLPFIEAVKNY